MCPDGTRVRGLRQRYVIGDGIARIDGAQPLQLAKTRDGPMRGGSMPSRTKRACSAAQ